MHSRTKFYGKLCGENFSCFPPDRKLESYKVSVCCNLCRNRTEQYEVVCSKCKNTDSQFSVVHFHFLSVATFSCTVCEKVCNSMKDLKRHVKIHTEHLFVCCICEAMFADLLSLEMHFMSHNGKYHLCKICKVRFRTKEDLQLHAKMHFVKRSYLCEKCRGTFSSICSCGENLLLCSSHDEKHPISSELESEKIDLKQLLMEATHCDQIRYAKWIDSGTASARIKKRHHLPKACEQFIPNTFTPSKKFVPNTEQALVLLEHSLPSEKTIIEKASCSVCQKGEDDKTLKDGICTMCQSSFSPVMLEKLLETKHLYCHKCDICFENCCDLRKHLYSAKTFRRFYCTVCEKGFTKSYSLYVHELRHAKELDLLKK